ncbi:metallophosphoesterase [candidate division KSB1 bacterium]|nr:metallophosphoesterase [candidate division KSB1 bacterium]
MKRKLILLVVSILLVIICMVYAVYIEPQRLVVRRVPMYSEKLSQGFSLRIVHLSDLHFASMAASLREKVIRAVRRESPDIIVLTGDLISHADLFEPALNPILVAEIDSITTFMDGLYAPMGIYIVRGNHDIGNDKEVSDLLVRALRRKGYTALTNQSHSLMVDGQPIHLLGIDYSETDTSVRAGFSIGQQGENKYLQSGFSRKNSYCHYYYPDSDERWANYTVSARFFLTDVKKSGVGLTFYSQLHKGLDHYYRLRWSSSRSGFILSPHNTVITGGDESVPGDMQTNRWYRAKVQVTTLPQHIRLAAKVWPQEQEEPQNWQAVAYDSSENRLLSGTVGFWSIHDGVHKFDDLLVVTDCGDTLLDENWQTCEGAEKPPGWIDFRHNQAALPFLKRMIPDSCFTILLSHTAELIDAASEQNIDLMLCGHTHGGQVRLPLIGAPHLLFDARNKNLAGLYGVGQTTLFVNSGLGTILLPVRFMAPPEVVVIDVVGRALANRQHFN